MHPINLTSITYQSKQDKNKKGKERRKASKFLDEFEIHPAKVDGGPEDD